MWGRTTKQTLDLLKGAGSNDRDSMVQLAKAINQATGLVWYDLKPGVQLLAPLITPLVEKLPRVPGGGDTATRWKAITNIDTTNQSDSVEEGKRSGELTIQEVDYIAPYITAGLEQSVTWQAQWAGMNLDDVRAKVTLALLMAVRQSEERKVLGSNATIALGTPVVATPVDTTAAPGGAIPANTVVHVRCVALTHEGWRLASVANGITQQTVRNNNDGTTTTINRGTSLISVDKSVTTANDGNNAHAVSASVTLIPGAMAYAWYVGATAAGATLYAITTVNSVNVLTATGSGAQAISALTNTDFSKNALSYDGMLSTFLGIGPQTNPVVTASGAIISSNANGVAGVGVGFTSDGTGGVAEINADLLAFWNASKLGPDEIYVPARLLIPLTQAVVAAGSASTLRFSIDVAAAKNVLENKVTGGVVIGRYLNPFTGQNILVRIHPDLPGGTLMYVSWQIPYTYATLQNIHQIKLRQDYYQIDWPLNTLKWVTGVYYDGVYQNYFPPAFGVRYNIGG